MLLRCGAAANVTNISRELKNCSLGLSVKSGHCLKKYSICDFLTTRDSKLWNKIVIIIIIIIIIIVVVVVVVVIIIIIIVAVGLLRFHLKT